MWTLGQIWIYPIKSLPGVEVSESQLLPAGNLEHDREFALVDETGRFVNAKRTAEIHRIRAQWDLATRSVALRAADSSEWSTFQLAADLSPLADWFSQFFQMKVRLTRQADGGFPDDTEAAGPTIVSTQTLRAIADWFPGLDVDEVRRRFRANLELDGETAFSEDALFGRKGTLVPFQIGASQLFGSNPCQRCAVPTRDTATGEIWPGFQKGFATRREATFPAWAERSRFDHFYRLSVNTVIRHSQPQPIRVGDLVSLEHRV